MRESLKDAFAASYVGSDSILLLTVSRWRYRHKMTDKKNNIWGKLPLRVSTRHLFQPAILTHNSICFITLIRFIASRDFLSLSRDEKMEFSSMQTGLASSFLVSRVLQKVFARINVTVTVVKRVKG